MYVKIMKPVFDFLAAFLFLMLISPLLMICILLIRICSKGSVFFIHERPGYKEKTIRVIKFRTMSNKTDEDGILLTNRQRITKIGAFMRKFSLDEIPQLVNVIKGDLSLVGPRPLEIRYLPHYTTEQRKRHSVKPGITGLAQVSGRNKLSWVEKFDLDIQYVDNLSFRLDINILFKTFSKVIKRDGINSDEDYTVKPFA